MQGPLALVQAAWLRTYAFEHLTNQLITYYLVNLGAPAFIALGRPNETIIALAYQAAKKAEFNKFMYPSNLPDSYN